MTQDHSNPILADLGVKPEFVEALRASLQPSTAVSSGVDLKVLESARLEIRRQAIARQSRRFGAAVGLAACLAVAATVTLIVSRRATTPPTPESRLASLAGGGDLDRNGRVDVLDAFNLARQLKGGLAFVPECDFNSDGVVDSKDVDVLALSSVRLNGGSLQ